jgi:hypothetical protein
MMQPKSDSGVIEASNKAAFEEQRADAQDQAAPGQASRKSNGSAHNVDHPGAQTVDAFVSQFFTKMFKRTEEHESDTELAALGDGTPWADDSQAILDRRRAERQEGPQLFAHYWDGGPPQSHDIRDISATGVYILADERWYPGTQVMILLQRPGATADDAERSIKVKAKVVRFGTDGMGFEFVTIKKKPASAVPEKLISARPDLGEFGAGQRELQRFLQKLPKHGA